MYSYFKISMMYVCICMYLTAIVASGRMILFKCMYVYILQENERRILTYTYSIYSM